MQAPLQNTQTPQSMVMASTKENKTHTIPGFLERLYEIDNFQWAASSPAGTVLKQYRFPDVLLSQPALSRKAYNFFGLRAGVELVVLVNKQKFQQGNLLISHLPGAKYNDAKNAMCQTTTPTASSANLATLTGMPRVNLDLMDATKAVLKVPYASPFVYYNLLSGDGTIGDFYITVYSPLQDIASSGTVSVQVMARFIDVDLQFPAGNKLAPFSKTPKVESLYGEFIQKPDLTTLANLVKEGTAIMQQVKDGSFRFQMNSETVRTQNFKPRALPNMAVSDESNNAHLLSLSTKNVLPSINMGEASKQEHRFSNIVQIPVYNSRFDISSSQNAGTNVWSKRVTLLDYTNAAPDGSIGVDYPTYIGQNFSKWRSSFKFHFRFVKTQFHSLRIRIFFAPNASTVVGVDRNAVISKIIDLEVNNLAEFEVPFIWPHPFLNNDPDFPYVPVIRDSLGMIGVDILTKMVHPDTVKNTIEVIVERSAGTDFDVNLPRELKYFPYDPRIEEDLAVVSGTNHFKNPLPDLIPLESGGEVTVYTLDPVNSAFMQTMNALPSDIKATISANADRFNQSLVGALNDLAVDGHKVTQATLRLPLPQILAKHDELRRRKRGVDTVDGWVRDLTEEGVEPNPGPVTYQGWSSVYIVDAFKFQMNTEQDDYRTGHDDTSYIRPVNSIQADKMALGGKVEKIDDMIHRSTVYASKTTTIGDKDLYIQPHMIGVARKDVLALNYGPTDMISYYANLYAFARGGVNLRIASSPDHAYTVILDPDSKTLSSVDTDALGEIDSPTGSALRRRQSVNIQQVIKPSLEGYGEWSVPFYSDTFMYYINPVHTQSPSVSALNMQCPYTTTIVRPTGAFSQFAAYRAACKDFEFSYLTGAPRIIDMV